ncbi:MAG: cytochrome c biogenesis protein CcsA [Gammaproteobacteria bacterium]|nr:cytochrome c biogenesis protein CcsA [Gammaproteobacteria bacterium]
MNGLGSFAYTLAGGCFTAALLMSLREIAGRQIYYYWISLMLIAGTLSITVLLAVRWIEIGQGPFLTLYEILISSLFGLGWVLSVAYVSYPHVRVAAPIALGVVVMLYLWASTTNQGYIPLPPTYSTPWLWVHVITGKIFLGCCLVASALAVMLMLPTRLTTAYLSARVLGRAYLIGQTWRWFAAAFLFHSAMLIAGAVWAQDAWGRYWDWDPLETWAFATWLVMAFGLHARTALRLDQRVGSMLIVAAFVLAFLTFFGVPFLSLSPHQGAI